MFTFGDGQKITIMTNGITMKKEVLSSMRTLVTIEFQHRGIMMKN